MYAAWIYIEINLHQISYCVCKINVFHSPSPIPSPTLSSRALKKIIYFHICRGYWKMFISFSIFNNGVSWKWILKFFNASHFTHLLKIQIWGGCFQFSWALYLSLKCTKPSISILTEETVAMSRCYAEMVDCGHVIPFYQHHRFTACIGVEIYNNIAKNCYENEKFSPSHFLVFDVAFAQTHTCFLFEDYIITKMDGYE